MKIQTHVHVSEKAVVVKNGKSKLNERDGISNS